MRRVNPVVLLVIIILSVVFFVYGLLHLLVRYLMKKPSFSSISHSNRNIETSASHPLERQLQQLFTLHDSRLDQALIDALPVFYYKDIVGSNEPFDCAVCLCEFSEKDMLRLLPLCSHAFHINCIDTWLLSNATCPLCRTLISPVDPKGNASKPSLNSSEYSRESWIMQENAGDLRVYSVRLGKYRSINADHGENEEQVEMISGCNFLDGRRCYSMGTFQYVVGSEMQVAFSKTDDIADLKLAKIGFDHDNFAANTTDREGKKIDARIRGESYSVSKIWLWSKRESPRSFLDTHNV